jgi:predicted HAD superfamily Cof-like phosphohydrolase
LKYILHSSLVRDFHHAFDVRKPSALTVEDVIRARNKLQGEETIETIEASFELLRAKSPEELLAAKAHLLKELADTLYVTFGYADLLNLPLDEAFVEVHLNNMSKRQPDGSVKRRADGKILKPDDYKEVDLRPLILGRA